MAISTACRCSLGSCSSSSLTTWSIRAEEAKLAGKRFRPAIETPYRWRDWAANPQGITGPELLAFINQDEAIRPDGKRGEGLFAYLRSLRSANGDRRDVIAKVFQGTFNRMANGYLLRDVVNKINEIHFTSKDEIHTLGALRIHAPRDARRRRRFRRILHATASREVHRQRNESPARRNHSRSRCGYGRIFGRSVHPSSEAVQDGRGLQPSPAWHAVWHRAKATTVLTLPDESLTTRLGIPGH